MEKEPILLQVCIKKQVNGENSRVFISMSDFEKTKQMGYPISIVDDKEFFVPTSINLYEHHYEVTSFSFPKDAKIQIKETPFVRNAQTSKIISKLK